MIGEMIGVAIPAIAVIGLLLVALRKLWAFGRRVGYFLDDWGGEAARPGVPERPGVMDRLASLETRMGKVEAELKPNGGNSFHDQVMRAVKDSGS